MNTATPPETIRCVASAHLPTKWGSFQVHAYQRDFEDGHPSETALALVLGKLANDPLVRIHSQCCTSEILGSLRCDCHDQLQLALDAIAREGRGVLIYEHQEGRGIGLLPKLQAYELQDAGLDTIDANHALGLASDCRNYALPVAILRQLGINRLRLLTNNPGKTRCLIDAGIHVVAQVPCEVPPTPHSMQYLKTKKERMGHRLSLRPSGLASIDAAIEDLRAGRMIVVVDDEDRENEGDLTMAADMITPETVNFMATHGRGLICLAMTGERLDELEIGPMSRDNSALHGTAFTVSIDVKGAGVTTGISAHDRAKTIQAVMDPFSCPGDFARPGHVFPLRAQPGGVLERRGQTEAAVDLARLAGLSPAGVICEIIADDGAMARGPNLVEYCKRHGLLMVSVADLVDYRLQREDVMQPIATTRLFPACLSTPAMGELRSMLNEPCLAGAIEE